VRLLRTSALLANPTSPIAELLNLAKVRVFTIVVEHGSASRAAALLFRAQSAVTRSVRELEETLGERLLERRPSSMLPTSVGRAVDERCQRIFGELRALAQWCAARQSRARPFLAGSIPSYLLNKRRLQLFVALARHQHMPSAAQALGISHHNCATAPLHHCVSAHQESRLAAPHPAPLGIRSDQSP
jgi:LysR family transcriptional regulator of gallate degradation